MKNKSKYRPSLTEENINKILELAKSENPISQSSLNLIAILAPFKYKIDNNGITPAYTTSRTNLMESLGAEIPDSTASTSTKEDYWLQCYLKWVDNPAACTLKEIEAAREHRYLHDLMSEREKEVFEENMFK